MRGSSGRYAAIVSAISIDETFHGIESDVGAELRVQPARTRIVHGKIDFVQLSAGQSLDRRATVWLEYGV